MRQQRIHQSGKKRGPNRFIHSRKRETGLRILDFWPFVQQENTQSFVRKQHVLSSFLLRNDWLKFLNI